MKLFKFKRLIIFFLTVVLLIVCIPFSNYLAADKEPVFSNEDVNAFEYAVPDTVPDVFSQNGDSIDVGGYNASDSIRRIIYPYNVNYGAEKSYTASADIKISDFDGNYSRIWLIVGKGTYNNTTRFIGASVCFYNNIVRTAISATNDNGGDKIYNELRPSVLNGYDVSISHKYTVSYNDGVLSFWVDGNQLYDSVDLKTFPGCEISDISPCFGIMRKNASGVVNNIKLWGKNVTNYSADNEYAMANDYYNACSDCMAYVPKLEGNAENVSTKVKFSDELAPVSKYVFGFDVETYREAQGTGNWKSVRAQFATAKLNGIEKPLVIYLNDYYFDVFFGNAATNIKGKVTLTDRAKSNIKIYLDNGILRVYKDGNLNLTADFNSLGYTDIVSSPSVWSENIKSVTENFVIYSPYYTSTSIDLDFINKTNFYNAYPDTKEYAEIIEFTGENKSVALSDIPISQKFVCRFDATCYENNKAWKCIRIQFATAEYQGEECKLVLYLNDTYFDVFRVKSTEPKVESILKGSVKLTKNCKTGVTIYFDNGFLRVYNNGNINIKSDLIKSGYTDIQSSFVIKGEQCNAKIEDIVIYGDGISPSVTADASIVGGKITVNGRLAKRNDTVVVNLLAENGYQLKAGSLRYTYTENQQTVVKPIINNTETDVTGTEFSFKVLTDKPITVSAQFLKSDESSASIATLGTQIRDDNGAVRFLNRIYFKNSSEFAAESDVNIIKYKNNEYTLKSYGAILLEKEKLSGSELLLDNIYLNGSTPLNVCVTDSKKIYKRNEAFVDFVIPVNVSEQNCIYAVRGYMVLTPLGGGEAVTVYGDVFEDSLSGAVSRRNALK